jgi:hypothetical protein
MATALLDAAGLTLFFKDPVNMGLYNHMSGQLAIEGITEPEDFKEFDKDGVTAIFSNLFNSLKVPIPGLVNIAAGCLPEILVFEVSAKSKMLTIKLDAIWTLATCPGPSSSISLSSGKLLWNARKQIMEHPPSLQSTKRSTNRLTHLPSISLKRWGNAMPLWIMWLGQLLGWIPHLLPTKLVILTLWRLDQLMAI